MDKKDERSKGFNPALAAPYGEGPQLSQEDIYEAFGAGPKTLGMLRDGMITDDKMAGSPVPLIDNKLKFEPGKIGHPGTMPGTVMITMPNGANMSMDDVLAAIKENDQLRKAVAANHEWHKTFDDDDMYEGSSLCEENSAALERRQAGKTRGKAYGERMVRFCPECGSVGAIGGSFINCCPDGNHARRVPESVVNTLRQMFVRSLDLTNPALDVRTRILVRDFSKAMADRFMEAQKKRGLGHEVDWMREDWAADCHARMKKAMEQNEEVDVANYAAIIWYHTTRLEGE